MTKTLHFRDRPRAAIDQASLHSTRCPGKALRVARGGQMLPISQVAPITGRTPGDPGLGRPSARMSEPRRHGVLDQIDRVSESPEGRVPRTGRMLLPGSTETIREHAVRRVDARSDGTRARRDRPGMFRPVTLRDQTELGAHKRGRGRRNDGRGLAAPGIRRSPESRTRVPPRSDRPADRHPDNLVHARLRLRGLVARLRLRGPRRASLRLRGLVRARLLAPEPLLAKLRRDRLGVGTGRVCRGVSEMPGVLLLALRDLVASRDAGPTRDARKPPAGQRSAPRRSTRRSVLEFDPARVGERCSTWCPCDVCSRHRSRHATPVATYSSTEPSTPASRGALVARGHSRRRRKRWEDKVHSRWRPEEGAREKPGRPADEPRPSSIRTERPRAPHNAPCRGRRGQPPPRRSRRARHSSRSN